MVVELQLTKDDCHTSDCSVSLCFHWIFLTRRHRVSTFMSMTPLDIFKETSGDFQAMCVA